jgi:glutamate/tyrosine decarboxylase-like PLP-dependent enzyme
MEIERFINEVGERVVKYLNDSDERPLSSYVSPDDLRNAVDMEFPKYGHGREKVLGDIDQYLRSCVKTDKAEFMNPLWAGVNVAGLAGEIIANLANTSMYTYEIAPLASLIELQVLKKLADLSGFTNFDNGGAGTFTTGGSNGNMLGMLCARQYHFPESTSEGIDGRKLVAFVSKESHYSVAMSGNVLGIGHKNVIKVACDDAGRMSPAALQKEIHRTRSEGKTPFCIITTAGTTVRGAFDPFDAVSDIAERENIWHHVDGAWGGPALFSSSHRRLMKGLERADSTSIDAHKIMGMQLTCSVFLVNKNHRHVLGTVCSHGDSAHYLYHEATENVDLGRYSLQCGRRNDALKLWLAWREIGDQGWENMIDRYMSLAAYLERKVKSEPRLEMMSSRQWTNVCFRYKFKASDDEKNVLNSSLREKLMQEGKFMISKAKINEDIILRPVLANPKTTETTLDNLIKEILRIGDDMSDDHLFAQEIASSTHEEVSKASVLSS